MPFSKLTTEELFKIDKVKLVRTDEKLYFGEALSRKK
jgi:hypothetical protein